MAAVNPIAAQNYVYNIRPATPSDLPQLPDIEASAGTLFRSLPGLEYLADDSPMSVDTHREFVARWSSGPMGRHGSDQGEGGTWVVVASRVRSDNSDEVLGDMSNEIVGFVVTEALPVKPSKENDGQGAGVDVEGKAEGCFLHIHELSIHVMHQRRGLAGRLLGTVKGFVWGSNTYQFQPETQDAAQVYGSNLDRPTILGLSLTTFRDVPFNRPFYEKCGFRLIEKEAEIERLCGVEAITIFREDKERFEGEESGRKDWKRCWMACEL